MTALARAWAILLFLAVLLALLARGMLPATTRPMAQAALPTAMALPEAAVQAVLVQNGLAYAGDCTAAVSPRDLGRYCSRMVAERDGVRAYLVGRTFGEFSRWIFVAQIPGGDWEYVGDTPLDFLGEPLPPWPAWRHSTTE